MQNKQYDILIIGGGINGIGIANDAAGRGLNVLLCEQDDLASGTSWKSSKLIHGGLRYLEHYEFKLVKKALAEREILLKKAPHLIYPIEFVLPHNQYLRPAWLIRAGLFLYDHLSKHSLPRARQINLQKYHPPSPLKPQFVKGFTYADCGVDDARLVVLNAIQARELGATILTRTEVIDAVRREKDWQVQIKDKRTEAVTTVSARLLINASGPWVEQTLKKIHVRFRHRMSLVKGSHIVVPKLYEGDHAYILQNHDQRIVFVIPFHDHYSLIGTTDVGFHDNLDNPQIDQNEITYLCALVNEYFAKPISSADIVWSFAGVRPLKTEGNDLAAISRDYDLSLDMVSQQAPLLNIFGGKLTTYRELAEDALAKIKSFFPHMKGPWTATSPLPGGDLPHGNFTEFHEQFRQQYPWLEEELATHYTRNYGTLAHQILKGARNLTDLGESFDHHLYQREVEYLINHEWAQTAEDILWRRTKFGINFSSVGQKKLSNFFSNQLAEESLITHY